MKKLENPSGNAQVQYGIDLKSLEKADIRSYVTTDAFHILCQVNTVMGKDLWRAAPCQETAFEGEIIEFVGLGDFC